MNPLRAELGLPPVQTIEDVYLAASVVLAYTAEPFEYPRSDWPAKVKLVGPGLWEPPADPPAWLDESGSRSCSSPARRCSRTTAGSPRPRALRFAGEPFEVVVTTADVDPAGLDAPTNVRVERFLPHAPLLERAACVVCHAGMGITQKALAHGVPVVAVPFGRDQPEVARRVEVARAGVRLPARKLTPDRLRDAVRRAIELRPGAERIAAAFAAAGGAVAAANELEALIPRSTEVTVQVRTRQRKEHPMTAIKDAAAEFLGHKRVAVTGVSRTPASHGSNVVYKRLRERGYEVFAVNPNARRGRGRPLPTTTCARSRAASRRS